MKIGRALLLCTGCLGWLIPAASADIVILKNGSILEGRIYRTSDKYMYVRVGEQLGSVRVLLDNVNMAAMEHLQYLENREQPRPVQRSAPTPEPDAAAEDGNPDDAPVTEAEKPAPLPTVESQESGISSAIAVKLEAILDEVMQDKWDLDEAAKAAHNAAGNSIGRRMSQ